MNARATLAAEGLPRRGFTVAEVERMVEVGLLGEDERIELIGGERVPMSPKGNGHEVLKAGLPRRCASPTSTFGEAGRSALNSGDSAPALEATLLE